MPTFICINWKGSVLTETCIDLVVFEILAVFASRLVHKINLLDLLFYKNSTMILQSNLEQTTNLTDVIDYSTDIFENILFNSEYRLEYVCNK